MGSTFLFAMVVALQVVSWIMDNLAKLATDGLDSLDDQLGASISHGRDVFAEPLGVGNTLLNINHGIAHLVSGYRWCTV